MRKLVTILYNSKNRCP